MTCGEGGLCDLVPFGSDPRNDCPDSACNGEGLCIATIATPLPSALSTLASSSTSALTGASSQSLIWTATTVSQPVSSPLALQIASLTIVLSNGISGPLVSAPTIAVSGTLTVDISELDLTNYESSYQLFSTAPSGSFSVVTVVGGDECVSASVTAAGELFLLNECSVSLALSLTIFC